MLNELPNSSTLSTELNVKKQCILAKFTPSSSKGYDFNSMIQSYWPRSTPSLITCLVQHEENIVESCVLQFQAIDH